MDARKAAARAGARRARRAADLASEDARRLARFLEWLPRSPGVIATYASLPTEPGTTSLIDALAAAGWDVRLPVLRREPDWARFAGWDAMRAGWQDIPEPTGVRLGAASLEEADVVVVSCLAVDDDGYRLGMGGGWYDRALAHLRDDAVALAWAREAERVPAMAREPHDVPVSGWVTEHGLGWARRAG